MARKSSGRPTSETHRPDAPGASPRDPFVDPSVEDAEIVGEADAAADGEGSESGHGPGLSEVEATPGAESGAAATGPAEPTSSVEAVPEGDPMGEPDGDGPTADEAGPAPDAPSQDAADETLQRDAHDDDTALVRAGSMDLVPPPGPTPPPEEPEPTAADAPEVIEVPPTGDQVGSETHDGSGDPAESMRGTDAAAMGAAGLGAGAGAGRTEAGTRERDGTARPSAASGAPESRGAGIGSMILGGLIAGAIGFAAAWFLGQGPRDAASANAEAFAERISALEARVDPDLSPIEARLDELAGAVPDTAPLDSRIAAIEESLGNVADTATLEAVGDRLAALEDGLAGLSEAASASGTQEEAAPAVDAATADAVGAVESITSENAERLAALETEIAALPDGLGDVPGEIDGLRSDLGEVQDSVASVEERVASAQQAIDEVRASVQSAQDAVEAERLALEAAAEEEARTLRAEAALTGIRAAIDTGEPLTEPLASYAEATGNDVPDALSGIAEDGAPTLGSLQSAFDAAARNAIAVAPAEPGPAGFLRAQIGLRSLSEREGDGVDAVLSRAQARLQEGDLSAAVEAASTLEGRPAEAMEDWLARARTRLAATQAADGLSVPASTEG